jgi:hypothetical protein
LKARLAKVESLLRTAGILQEGDISHDEFFNDDDYDDDGRASQNSSSTSSQQSKALRSLCSKNGDLEGTPIFRADERDDSRYFGKRKNVLDEI